MKAESPVRVIYLTHLTGKPACHLKLKSSAGPREMAIFGVISNVIFLNVKLPTITLTKMTATEGDRYFGLTGIICLFRIDLKFVMSV